MGKSLNDNPFNNIGFNINGIGISQEAIEENKKALGQIEEVKEAHDEEELKANVSEFLTEDIKNNINVSSEEKDLIDTLIKSSIQDAKEELKQKPKPKKDIEELQEEIAKQKQDKPINDNIKERYTKKTYRIKDEYIDLIEGLALLKETNIKDIVNELLAQAFKDLDNIDSNIRAKALKELKNKDKKNNLF